MLYRQKHSIIPEILTRIKELTHELGLIERKYSKISNIPFKTMCHFNLSTGNEIIGEVIGYSDEGFVLAVNIYAVKNSNGKSRNMIRDAVIHPEKILSFKKWKDDDAAFLAAYGWVSEEFKKKYFTG